MNLPLKTYSVDAIITSPPYYGSKEYGAKTLFRDGRKMLGTEITTRTYANHVVEALNDSFARVLKPYGVLWLVIGDKDDQVPVSLAPQRVITAAADAGWLVAQEIHWIKTYRVSGKKVCLRHPPSYTEKIYMIVKSQEYRYDDTILRSTLSKNYWPMSPAKPNSSFAELPEMLPEVCIMASTRKGDIVLDPFCGTGVVVKVAERLGRVGIGCDLLTPG